MIAQSPPIGVVKVELFDTETEYKLSSALTETKRERDNWKHRTYYLLGLNILTFVSWLVIYNG